MRKEKQPNPDGDIEYSQILHMYHPSTTMISPTCHQGYHLDITGVRKRFRYEAK